MKTLSDRALLERALVAIEQVMARTGTAHDQVAGTPAGEAVEMCLTAAAALVDVAQVLLLRAAPEQSPEVQSQEWQALIGHTKNASRTAHQAVLVLSSQRNLVAAQDGIALTGQPGRSAAQAAH